MTRGKALTRNRDYLGQNRRMIIGRSLAAGMVGSLPIPVVEDWLASTIRRGAIRRIAESRQVDISRDAAQVVADGSAAVPEWTELAAGRLIYRILTRPWRRVLIATLAARRVRVASRTYAVATLFDHYCARLHVGVGLEKSEAADIRGLIDAALENTEGGLSRRLFSRALIATARNSARMPFELLNWASGGAVRRLLKRRREFEAVTEVDEALERQLAGETTFLARAAAAAEIELTAEGNPYLSKLIENFERRWREEYGQNS